MTEPHDPNVTADVPAWSVTPDSLDAGLAAGFGRPMAPRSSLGDLRPVLLKEAEGESEHIVKPKSDAMPPKEETGDRYHLSGEIARGGMGVVLRGRDVDLGRDLAVKVLLEKYANRPEVARRFVEEAQIGGQLQHPGVVPVYDIGRFGDRPFFTMKLVKGHTLAAILEDRADASADRPRLLGIALKVCETLAYAHAKGVIHRDLKPANIMVGAFGEVQVMDWGLAKVLAAGGIADEERAGRAHQEPEDVTTIRTARSSGSVGSFGTETEAGSLLGTPAYMPPEQANGDIANLDRRADVFGLGAILCEILTGKPPYVGRSSEEVRRKAANGDLADATARLGACGADAELIALTKKCLSPEAIDRPKDAQEVTEGLSAYLNGVQERLLTAERERAVAMVREAEQRKKRKVQLALALALVGLMLGVGAFAFWRAEQAQVGRERDARNAEAVASLLGQAEEALKAGDTAKAAVVLEAAKKRSAEGGAEKDADRLTRLEADLAVLRDLDAVDQFRWTWSENRFPDPVAVATRTREALERFGADPNTLSLDESAAKVSVSVVQERIVTALDQLLQHQSNTKVRALLRRLDADPYRDAVRDAVVVNDAVKLAKLAGQDDALKQPARFAAFLGDSEAIDDVRRRQLLLAAVIRRPGDPSVLMAMGTSYQGNRMKWAEERIRWYQAAIAAAPANYAAHINLGGVLCDIKEDYDGAIACFQTAISIDPMSAKAHYNLGNALTGKGQVDEAIACYRKAIELDPKHAETHCNLADQLARQGLFTESLAAYQRGHELGSKQRGWPYPSATWVRKAEAKAALEAKLPGFLKGEYAPGNTEEFLTMVSICRAKKHYHAATRLYAATFASDSSLADDLKAGHRYNAACYAALAAIGKGDPGAPGKLEEEECTRLRRLTLDWLKSDLAALTKLRVSGSPEASPFVVQTLSHWQKDADLTGIRDAAALAKLPADEQKVFAQLWADVTALLNQAAGRPNPGLAPAAKPAEPKLEPAPPPRGKM
jgi:serine/threonine protein kinase/tetratricopeptide (TPR) repeat protein